MDMIDPLSNVGEWVLSNLNSIVVSFLTVIIGYVIYALVLGQIRKFRDQGKLGVSLAWTMTRIAKWLTGFIIVASIRGQFGVTVGVISGLFALVGGTILGFASINAIGNAIAGLIVMINKPFNVGDRIFFNNQLADVEGIAIIYTKMRILDNVLISIPNQELLKTEIDTFGRERAVRRAVKVTPGYEYESTAVEHALMEAAAGVPGVLKEPTPYVWIMNFLDYAVEYTLYVFFSDIKRMQEIDAALYRSVLDTVNKHKIDIRTPLLLQQI
jgi:small conductance mechanosensitive channel